MKSTYPYQQPQYNLKELCDRAGITAPIMKKYQMLLKLGSGKKIGDRTYYSDQQLHMYRFVHQSRLAGISYKQIQDCYKAEQKLMKIRGGVDDPDVTHDVHTIFSNHGVTFNLRGENSKEIEEALDEYEGMKQMFLRKAQETSKKMKEFISVVDFDNTSGSREK